MKRTTHEEATETRSKILIAALDVFSRKGYSRTTFVDIAKEIGLSKGAIYWYFKTKPDLLAAVISDAEKKQCAHSMIKPPESIAAFRELMLAAANRVVENQAAQKFEFFCHFQIEWSTELMAEVKMKLEALRGDQMREFIQLLTHMQDIGELKAEANIQMIAYALSAMWVGSLRMALLEKCSFEEFRTLLEQHFDLLIGQYATSPLIEKQ